MNTDIFELFSRLNSIHRKQELEAALNWYSHTESKIYSEAREKDKDRTTELSESEIKHNEEKLRKLYYSEVSRDSNDYTGLHMTLEESYRNHAEIIGKIAELKNK
jgi:hypothetical protein